LTLPHFGQGFSRVAVGHFVLFIAGPLASLAIVRGPGIPHSPIPPTRIRGTGSTAPIESAQDQAEPFV
jgi:hypothetical protein